MRCKILVLTLLTAAACTAAETQHSDAKGDRKAEVVERETAEKVDTPPSPPASAGLDPIQPGECPLDIQPAKALGPVQLGMTRKQLEMIKLEVATSFEDPETKTEFANVGPYRASLCGGLVEEVWIEDLRLAPDCVTFGGKKIARDIPRDDFIGLFSGCEQAPPRIGGEFMECHTGGLRIGYGMGEFIQIRVGREGSALDDDCANVLDDGSPVPLEPDALAALVEQTVDSSELTDYWHVTEPDRRPLRIVGSDVLGAEPPFKKFGEPVVYVSADEARSSGKPFLEFTKLASSQTRATFELRYEVEGIVASVEYVKRHGDWQQHETQVSER